MSQISLKPSFFLDVLGDNPSAIPLRIANAIQEQAGGLSVVASSGLELEQFAQLGLCELEVLSEPFPDHYADWGGEDCDRLVDRYEQACRRIQWQNHTLRVVHVEWATGCGGESRDWVVADSAETARAFILEVERRTHHPGQAILVFSDGHWGRSHELYRATQSASFEDLVLADDLKQSLREDFSRFLDSQEQYERLGIAWRRGALLIGPPGNGKTHCVRALVKELGIASLYVQSLAHHYYTPEQMWKQVFNRARGLRPCVLVLEDLDTLVNEENRSFFLNQLDGFERNHGLIVLATTNYPERIDSAIIDRPSRFDRKYHFPLPSLAERETFLKLWHERLSEETNWSLEAVQRLASKTAGFSFAYMKELVISSVMQWMTDQTKAFDQVVLDQAKVLARQMKTEPASKGGAGKRSIFPWRNGSYAAPDGQA